MLIWRVCFVLHLLPFTLSWMLLVFSCWSTNGCAPSFLMTESVGMPDTCVSISNFAHMTKFIASSIPIILATVELVEFTLCLFDRENTAPFPNVSIASVRLRMLLCTVNEASILHNKVPDSSHPITSKRWTIALWYCYHILSINSFIEWPSNFR